MREPQPWVDTHDELGIPLANFRSLTTRVVLVIRVGGGEGVVLVVLAVLKDLDEDRRGDVREGDLHVLVGSEIWRGRESATRLEWMRGFLWGECGHEVRTKWR